MYFLCQQPRYGQYECPLIFVPDVYPACISRNDARRNLSQMVLQRKITRAGDNRQRIYDNSLSDKNKPRFVWVYGGSSMKRYLSKVEKKTKKGKLKPSIKNNLGRDLISPLWDDMNDMGLPARGTYPVTRTIMNGSTINRFIINRNAHLKREITGYYHQYYTGYKQPDNPDFLNVLKNTFNTESQRTLIDARDRVIDISMNDLPLIIKEIGLSNCICVCVPRAKAFGTYSRSQLMFEEAISLAANNIQGVIDGTDYIVRYKNTRTTHLRNMPREQNDGEMPYPGITMDTCRIYRQGINNQNIILIDDIYTKSVNIAEDCIQALLCNGAKNVIFYSIGYTRRF